MSDIKSRVKVFANPKRNNGPENVSKYTPHYKSLGIKPEEFKRPRMEFVKLQMTMPNVGNNIDHSWSSLDKEIIDDISEENIMPDHEMIDNNDYVTDQALGINSSVESINHNTDDLYLFLNSTDDNSFTLIVNGVIVRNGTLEEIEKEASDLVFGEHPLSNGESIPIENILIVKRIGIKTGLFLEG